TRPPTPPGWARAAADSRGTGECCRGRRRGTAGRTRTASSRRRSRGRGRASGARRPASEPSARAPREEFPPAQVHVVRDAPAEDRQVELFGARAQRGGLEPVRGALEGQDGVGERGL